MPLILGDKKIKDIYVGDRKIAKAYLGDRLVYSADNGNKIVLPDGYTQVEYIESTGTQYIDTGVTGFIDKNYESVIEHTFTSTSNIQYLFGITSGSASSSSFSFAFNINSAGINGRFNQNFRYFISGIPEPQKFTYKTKSKNIASVGENIVDLSGISFSSSLSSSNMYIFTSGYDNTDRKKYASKIKLYSFIASNTGDGSLIRNFIPCKNQSGTVGLYDLVENKFYGNNGTGYFIAGPEV